MQRVLLACALATALTVSAAAATVSYAAPAGKLPAGRVRGSLFAAVLPSGRLVTPAGVSAVTGARALGLALTPDGRYAIVANDGSAATPARSSIDPDADTSPSLAVLDTASMSVVSRYRPANGETYFGGIVAAPDPARPGGTLVLAAGGDTDAVYAFTLDDTGRLTPDVRHTISIPGPVDGGYADAGHSTPAQLTVAPDGRHAYVVNAAAGTVAALDLASRAVLGAPHPVGFFPSAAAVAGDRLIVTNEGQMRYALAAARTVEPPFGTPPAALERASSLSLVGLTLGGALEPPALATAGPSAVPMDPAADGLRVVGGAHPTAVVATPDGRFAFVAMTNVDRIATVALRTVPRVVGGTELRLFDRGPYGTQPSALALSRDGSRLYVALRGLDAIAVVDARDPVHLHRLGLIPTGWAPSAMALAPDDRTLYVANEKGFGHDGGAIWSTAQKIDLAGIVLGDSTRATLAATRSVVPKPVTYPKAVRNVVVIAVDDVTVDALAGDPLAANAPNLRALAQRYAFAANFFADADDAPLAHQVLVAGVTTPFGETTRALATPVFGGVDDPEDAPRIGTIFTALARHNIGFRDYGGFLDLAGFNGSTYAYDVPAAAALAGHADPAYPADPAIADTQRAAAFARDYDAQIAPGNAPRFTYVWLSGTRLAETDAAVGAIVEHLSHLPAWRSTAIVIVSGAAGSADRVDPAHAFAIVVSPYAKRHYTGLRHLSTASVLKTVDGLFAMPPLSLGDLLANDMNDFFTPVPDLHPFAGVHSAAL